jgi:hypothetical protein
VIVETCRAGPPSGTARIATIHPPLGSETPAVSSGGQLVASIEFVGYYPAGRVAVQHRQLPELLQAVLLPALLSNFPRPPCPNLRLGGVFIVPNGNIPTPSRATSPRKGVLAPVPKSA